MPRVNPAQCFGQYFYKSVIFIAALVFCLATNFQATHAQTKLGRWLEAPNLPSVPYSYFSKSLPDYINDAKKFDRANTKNPNLNNIATLGRVLFYDRKLSKNKLVSCASCHDQNFGFDDRSQFSIGFTGKITKRNSIGLTYARFNQNNRYFWDESVNGLPQASLRPFTNSIEMGLKKEELLTRISQTPFYYPLFIAAFGNSAITREKIGDALATFIAALSPFSSKYDMGRLDVESLDQEFGNFSAIENRGKFLFFNNPKNGGGGCVSCHQTQVFIATEEATNIGLDRFSASDKGIMEFSNIPADDGKFRVPSLRNITKRAPFMHDGRFATLEQVVEHYSTGVQLHQNLSPILKDENEKPIRLNFTENDKHALVAFLNTLTDEHLKRDQRFSNPFRQTKKN